MKIAGGVLAVVVAAAAMLLGYQSDHTDHPGTPIAADHPELHPAMLLLRDGKTDEARRELQSLLAKNDSDAELYFQLGRSYLLDYYGNGDPAKARTALALALEALDSALRKNPDHVPALKAKAVIHARAELLHYDPNLAYSLGLRIAKLQPGASEYLLTLTDWLSGEVRFNAESEHRVPHDPLLGLNRSIELLERVIDNSVPHSNEEAVALFQMGRSLSRRGSFAEAIRYFNIALTRSAASAGRPELFREIGAAHYRAGEFMDAARAFYRALEAQNNLTDQWLLKVSLEQVRDGSIQLPPSFEFPAAPAAGEVTIEYEDVAKQFGVNRRDGNGTCAFGDIDGDGRQDLVLAGSGTFIALYRNEGKRFREVTAAAGLANVASGYSLNLIDYDNDGRLDLYITMNGWNGPMPNRLFRNMGDGTFRDVSAASGAADSGDGFVSVWGDLDNDGLLDLVVANGVLKDGSTPQVYRNKGDGTFENVTRKAGIVESPTYGVVGTALGDYDKDGDLDIFINGLGTSPNRLYRNDGNFHFTDVTRKAGVTQPNHNGFVAFFLDYNNDGWPDILTTSLAPWDAVVQSLTRFFRVADKHSLHPDSVRLFRNKGDGTFTDVTLEAGLIYPMGVMGAGVADLDNDGFVDFYFGTGDPQLTRIEPNRLFRNHGDGTFGDITRSAGIAQPGRKGHGVCFTDLDEDGSLEVYAQLGGHYPGDHAENAWYRNRKPNGNHWVEVELTGVKSNRFAVGAAITLSAAGGRRFYREVKGSEGFGSTNPYRQHFGLGNADRIDVLEVMWPGGKKQTLSDVGVDRIIRISEK